MNKVSLLILISCVAFFGCTKKTTNVYTMHLPAYTVNGITDVYVKHGSPTPSILPIDVQYQDSAQQTVTVSLSGLPDKMYSGLANGTIVVGIPTFSFVLNFSNTDKAIAPGTYPLTLTTTGTNSVAKSFNFKLVIYE